MNVTTCSYQPTDAASVTRVQGLDVPGGFAPRLAQPGLPRTTRVGTHERDAVVEQLQAHYVEGRLSSAELSERVEQALAGRTLGDLDLVLADLPPLPVAAAPETSADEPVARPSRQRRHAKAGTCAEQSFRAHATSYLLVMVLLVTIWLLTTPGGYFWPIWPMLGWGIGLASHGLGGRAVRHRA